MKNCFFCSFYLFSSLLHYSQPKVPNKLMYCPRSTKKKQSKKNYLFLCSSFPVRSNRCASVEIPAGSRMYGAVLVCLVLWWFRCWDVLMLAELLCRGFVWFCDCRYWCGLWFYVADWNCWLGCDVEEVEELDSYCWLILKVIGDGFRPPCAPCAVLVL